MLIYFESNGYLFKLFIVKNFLLKNYCAITQFYSVKFHFRSEVHSAAKCCPPCGLVDKVPAS